MRLMYHILNDQDDNKNNSLHLVSPLLRLLPCGIGSSDVLTELFEDNPKVDNVPDGTIKMFIDLIRKKGRLARYVRFLETLLTCRGKAVRPNQWRISSMLLEEPPPAAAPPAGGSTDQPFCDLVRTRPSY